MKAVLAIAWREIRARKTLFPSVLLLGILPIFFPYLGVSGTYTALEARDITANVLAGILGTCVAAFLGFTIIGRDVEERRLLFYFSRPQSALAIWAGKTMGGLATTFAAPLLVLAPLTLLGGGLRHARDWKIPSLLTWLPVPFPQLAGATTVLAIAWAFGALFFLAQFVGTAARGKWIWVLLDFTLLLVLAAAVIPMMIHLAMSGAIEAERTGLTILAALLTFGLTAVSFISLKSGPSDTQRAARASFLTLGAILLPILLGFSLYGKWALRVRPSELTSREMYGQTLVAAPSGEWLIASGMARGHGKYSPVFLMTADAKQYFNIGAFVQSPLSPVFSQDGLHAAWLLVSFIERDRWSYDFVSTSLGPTMAKPVRTGLGITGDIPLLFLAADGGRAAILSGDDITVLDIPSRHRVGVAHLPKLVEGIPSRLVRAHFDSAIKLRLFRSALVSDKAERRTEIFELDIRSKKLEQTGTVQRPKEDSFFVADPTCTRLLFTRPNEIEVSDARTGSRIWAAEADKEMTFLAADFLADGRLAAVDGDASGTRLMLYARDGKQERQISLGACRRAVLGGQPDAEHLSVWMHPEKKGDLLSGNVFLVHLTDGTVHRVAQRLYPVFKRFRWMSPDPAVIPLPGSITTRLFYGPDSSLIDFNQLTGEQRVIIGNRNR